MKTLALPDNTEEAWVVFTDYGASVFASKLDAAKYIKNLRADEKFEKKEWCEYYSEDEEFEEYEASRPVRYVRADG